MQRLEIKTINGKKYVYATVWGKKNGKCRRLSQRYLGTEAVVMALGKDSDEKHEHKPLYVEVFQYGLPIALWNEIQKIKLIETVDNHCEKRDQGLTVGIYIAISAINRAAAPVSKNEMWEWFSKTSLSGQLPGVSESYLTSQHFFNHANLIEDCKAIWESLIKRVVDQEKIDLSSISYDGTNYYTFINTFNVRCSIAKRGKNKQGRANLRQVNYSLFCAADSHMPLYYDVYEGNRNDYTQFPEALGRFEIFFEKLSKSAHIKEKTTLVFDKGNCSADNFERIDQSGFHFVTSAKLDEHKELTFISNQDPRLKPCSADLDHTKAFVTKKSIHGKERTVVVSYNENLFEAQLKTLQTDIEKATQRLTQECQRLEDRANGLIKGGKAPTQASVTAKCKEILSREYLKDIFTITISTQDAIKLKFSIDQAKLNTILDTYLGKNLIITSRHEWMANAIISAYRSQYIIEGVFKDSKSRDHGCWWPLYHWTDSKIHVHALYCTIALLLRALMMRRIKQAGVKISMKRLLQELSGIEEVVNYYAGKRKNHTENVLTKTSETQKALADILGLSLVAV